MLTRIQGYGHVAARYGLEEAIFLDTIVHWWRVNRADGRNLHEGRTWTYNTLRAFQDLFPWWSPAKIRRIIASCVSQEAVLTGHFCQDQRDRTTWYSPGEELLGLYGETPETGNCICQETQMDAPESTRTSADSDKCIKEHVITHDITDNPPISPQGDVAAVSQRDEPAVTPGDAAEAPPEPRAEKKRCREKNYRPEWFAAFWKRYPRKDGKQQAVKAWNKLRPDWKTCGEMSRALERDKHSRQWTKDGGEFIPLPATWINQRRWENLGVDLSQLPEAAELTATGGSCWCRDPEVTRSG